MGGPTQSRWRHAANARQLKPDHCRSAVPNSMRRNQRLSAENVGLMTRQVVTAERLNALASQVEEEPHHQSACGDRRG